MARKVTNFQKYGEWLLRQTSGFSEFVGKVAVVTAAVHPSDHKFTESQEFPGTCKICGWIDPVTKSDCSCQKTLAEHVALMPEFLSEQREISMIMSALAEGLGAVVIEISTSPRRSRSIRRTDD
jgi:hypothetical protein